VRKTSFFECFPYVCPEPVLAKSSFLYINGSKKPFSAGYTDAINIDKLNAAVTSKLYCNRANCYVKLEMWEEAAADAGDAIARDERYGKAYALRGQARMTLENYDDACKDYNQASELEPESKAFKESLKEVCTLCTVCRAAFACLSLWGPGSGAS
jgi:tetratricopeptide (TPR) repeat protein